MEITVTYQAVDGFREKRAFKTLAGARKFAHKGVGARPDLGSHYAVSFDGIGRVTVQGANLADLFPETVAPVDPRDAEFERVMQEERALDNAELEARFPDYEQDLERY